MTRGLHNLALLLHKTVGELLDTMTPAEFASWQRFFEERERDRKRAEMRAKGIIDFTDPESTSQLIAAVQRGSTRP